MRHPLAVTLIAECPATEPGVFVALKRRLDAPRPRRLSAADFLESLHPHAPDAHAPTPADWREVREQLRQFPHRQRVVCAAIAAEMALPVWESAAVEPPLIRSPHAAIECALRWAAGEATESELSGQSELALSAGRVLGGPAQQAAFAASFTAFTFTLALQQSRESTAAVKAEVATMLYERAAANAVQAAYRAVAPIFSPATRQRFLCGWWARCTSRLAFADVLTADIVADLTPDFTVDFHR